MAEKFALILCSICFLVAEPYLIDKHIEFHRTNNQHASDCAYGPYLRDQRAQQYNPCSCRLAVTS